MSGRRKGRRVTHSIRIDDAEGAIQVTEDDWRSANVPYFNPFEPGVKWKGWCEFELIDDDEVADEEVNQDEAEDEEMKGDEVNEDQPRGEEMRTEED